MGFYIFCFFWAVFGIIAQFWFNYHYYKTQGYVDIGAPDLLFFVIFILGGPIWIVYVMDHVGFFEKPWFRFVKKE